MKFEGESDSNNKRALKTALTRNTTYIAKISDDLWGLRKWYGMRAARKSVQAEQEEIETKLDAEGQAHQASLPKTEKSAAQSQI